MKYKDFISEATEDGISKMYTKSTYDEVYEILKTHCMKNLKNEDLLYRGMRKSGDYLLAEGKKGNRKSIEVSNHYTKIIDEQLPKLSPDYPLRSQSLICCTGLSHARSFGNQIYVVIPYDDVTVGVAQRYDIWYTKINIGHVNVDMYKLNNLWDDIGADDEFRSLEHLAKYIASEYKAMEKGHVPENKIFMDMFDGIDDIKQNVIDAYNVKNMKFEFIKLHELNTSIAREIWFSGKAVLIKEDLFNYIKEDILSE